ncbi:MAG: phosphoribosylamine--glycine ligase [Deltaproteobacteria bacterium]|nr:phosphoribosylamine--glycine ligase [Deltaproteobacteria bacterium]
MNVLVIGNGGREHALVWKIRKSPLVKEIYCAKGNAGTGEIAVNIDISPEDVIGLRNFALANRIDLTVVGPELPLSLGLSDEFVKSGLLVVGPMQGAAEIESSKVFSKLIMREADIPTADFEIFEDVTEAEKYIISADRPLVVKADGLAQGKGVFPCLNKGEAVAAVNAIMREGMFGQAGKRVVIEEFLEGEEVSFMGITDGNVFVPFATSQDHKRAYDNDEGPNTGGMGAYSPAGILNAEEQERVIAEIINPLLKKLSEKGRPYRGFLYAGLMVQNGKPYVLEFNARMGDPETQPLMMRMKSDIVPLLLGAAEGNLRGHAADWDERFSVCVVMTAQGYPGNYRKGMEISGLEQFRNTEDIVVFHAGTTRNFDKIITNGGRVLGVTAIDEKPEKAIEKAYYAVSSVHFDGSFYRRDIGKRVLKK